MKPYKILRPTAPLWTKPIEVFVSERKHIKLPLKLFTKCNPITRKMHVADSVRINKI